MKEFSIEDNRLCSFLFQIIIPLAFLMICLRIPVISCDEAPFTEAFPGPIPNSYHLVPNNNFIVSQTGIDLPYLVLWSLVGIIFIQMLLPGRKLNLLYDIGINLLVSAGITLFWIYVNTPLLDGLAHWGPHIVTYIPLSGMLLVSFQRLVRFRFVKKKESGAPKIVE